ncbi:hypothetical protein P7H21_26440 [Paenibacillus larvae]|nr:hypothetical protein [Paenibacillus larvae]MDT2306785.1 hypothetical protein [Paenibacillus larvae]
MSDYYKPKMPKEVKTKVWCSGYSIEQPTEFEGKMVLELTFVSNDNGAHKYHEFLEKLNGFLYENNKTKVKTQMDKKELQQIFEANENAVKEMEQVFKEHESIETVIVEPNSWVGKELLSQTKRLVDLQRDVYSLSTLIKKYSTRTLKGEMPNESSTNAL